MEEKTVMILRCDGRYAVIKRPDKGLLAGLWQFPETDGTLEAEDVLHWAEITGLKPRELYRQSDKVHIFTHVQWQMRGFYLEISKQTDDFLWFTEEEITNLIALPTAYRQFWDGRKL